MQAHTVDAKAFAAAIKQAAEIVDTKSKIPVLARVVVAASRGAVRIFANNLDYELRAVVPCVDAWRHRDAFCVDFAALKSIVGAIKGAETLRLARDGARLTISAPPFKRIFSVADDVAIVDFPFPKRPTAKPGYECAMIASDWRAALSDVAEEMCEEETRYYLNGVYIEPLRGEPSRMVATDGHRLALRKFRPDREFIRECGGGYILPRDSVGALLKIAGNDESVTAEFRFNRAQFTGSNWRLSSKLIDGSFPDYRRVMPSAKPDCTIVDVAAAPLSSFADTAGRVAARKDFQAARLYFNGRIEASYSHDSAAVSLAETLDYVEKSGPDITIGVNARLLKSALRGLDAARLSMNDPGAPIMITSPQSPMLQRVLLPCRI
jgi:DNA polymerase-3 subunit beta